MDRRQFLVAGASAVALSAAVGPLVPATARAQTVRVRRNVMTMQDSDPFFADYAQGVALMHKLPSTDQRNWRNQALIHLNHCPHGAIDFVHWHRHYISYYEQIIGQLIGKPSFALPYWDWSNGVGIIPNPFYDRPQLNVTYWNDPSNAQSDNWGPDEVTTVGIRILPRGTGVQQGATGGAFTAQNLQNILAQRIFANFTNQLESSPHNNGHMAVGGTQGHMGDGMSPLDPIFWLHHCMVDYMWAKWQSAGNVTPPLSYNYSGQFVTATGQPAADVTSANALYYPALGYQYEGLTLPSSAAVAARTGRAPAARMTSAHMTAATPARTLAATSDATVVSAPYVASLTLAAAGGQALTAKRLESAAAGRVLAEIEIGNAPTVAPMLINVFINKPDADAKTSVADPHFAGSFSFFGGHRGHLMPQTISIDLTGAVAKLGASGRNVTMQLVPVMLQSIVGTPPTFTVRSAKIVRG